MSDSGPSQASFMDNFKAFIRTRKGLVILVEIVLCIVILVCYGASNVRGYVTVPVVELVLCIVYLIIFAGQFDKQITFIHWGWSDFLRCVIAGVLFIIISLVTLIRGGDGAAIAAGVFGLLVGILFGYDAYITLPKLRKAHTAAATESPDGI
ncbi:proteolipid protein 2 [Rhinophrynus dorsalis]